MIGGSAASPATASTPGLADILGYSFVGELTAAEHVDRIAWVETVRGVRNVWAAAGPDFRPHQVTRYTQDDGQEITHLRFSRDGGTIVYVLGGSHDANWPAEGNLAPDPANSPVQPKVGIWAAPFDGGEPRLLSEGDQPAVSAKGMIAFVKDDQIWSMPLDGSAKPERLLFDRGKDRTPIAALEADVAAGLVDRLTRARDYWQGQLSAGDPRLVRFSSDRLHFLLVLLSRLCIRLDDMSAAALHMETLALCAASQLQHPRFDDPIVELLGNTCETVDPAHREPLALGDLQLPLREVHRGLDPINWLRHSPLKQPRRNPLIRTIVGNLLGQASGDQHTRRSALGRLIYLNTAGALTPAELRRFSKVAWSTSDSGDPPIPAYGSSSNIFGLPYRRLMGSPRDRESPHL